MAKLAKSTLKQIDDAVATFELSRSAFETDAANLQNRIVANAQLKALIHSVKWRAKEPSHLRDKLCRKANLAIDKGEDFTISAENVFDRVPDLAGVRLLHLHMRQIEMIHPLLSEVFAEEGYVISERPEAKTWDPEYEGMFRQLKVKVQRNESMYTSVHYVVRQNKTNRRRCEVQVRTLAEEVWGEISHTINYPNETSSVACREQLKVLARFVTGCSRLVDSIVTSHQDHESKVHNTIGTRSRNAKRSPR